MLSHDRLSDLRGSYEILPGIESERKPNADNEIYRSGNSSDFVWKLIQLGANNKERLTL